MKIFIDGNYKTKMNKEIVRNHYIGRKLVITMER